MFKIKTSDGWKEIHDASKQDTLIGTETTGQNIKTINGETILGTGDLTISGEPAEYIKDITQASNVYTATKKDGTTTVSWTIPDISGKADTTTVEGIETRVGNLETDMTGKAEQTDLNTTNENLGQLKNDLDGHIGDEDVHLQSGERDTWNGKQDAITGDNKLDADFLKEGTTNKLVTETDKTKWNGYETGKQNTLSAERLAACDSGITTTLVGQIGTNQTNIQAINDSEVMKSGITSTKVSTYDGYATTIAGKQKQIYYGETEPTGSADGDVWVF